MIRLSTFADNGWEEERRGGDGITASTNCEIDSSNSHGPMGASGRKGGRGERSRFQRGDTSNIFWPNNPMKRAKGGGERGRRRGRRRREEGNCGRDSISKSDKGERRSGEGG